MSELNMEKQDLNTNTKFCKHCGQKIDKEAVICILCGKQVEELKSGNPNIVINNSNDSLNANANLNTNTNVNTNYTAPIGKPKSKVVALLLCLCLIFGLGGLHKFYEGKILMGIIYLFTGGLFIIGSIIDLFALLGKPSTYYV